MATGKRLLTQQPPFEVCKKLKSEVAEIESPPNTDHLRFGNKVEEFLAQVKNDEMDQFKGTMGAFCEITNNLLTMIRKNAELHKDVEVAKEKAKESDKALEDLKKAYNKLLNKAEDSGKRAEKAEKALEEMKIAFKAIAFGGFGKALQDFANGVTRAYEVAMLENSNDA